MLDNVGFNSSDSSIIGIGYCKSGSYGFAPLLYIKLFIAIFVGLSHIFRHLWNKTRRRTLMLILILIVFANFCWFKKCTFNHQWIIISKVVVISNYFKNDSYFNKRLVNGVKYMYVYIYTSSCIRILKFLCKNFWLHLHSCTKYRIVIPLMIYIWLGNFYPLRIALRNNNLYHIPITRTVLYYNKYFTINN